MVSFSDSPGAVDPHRRLIELWIPAWSARDTSALLPLMRDDCSYEDAALGAVSHGKDHVAAFLAHAFAGISGLTVNVSLHILEFTHAGMEWTASGKQTGTFLGVPATGKPFTMRGASIIEMGPWPQTGPPRLLMIARQTDYWDRAGVLAQLRRTS